MSSDIAVVQTYARALFAAAGDSAGQVDTDLSTLVSTAVENAELWNWLNTPSVGLDERTSALIAAVQGGSALTVNFLKVLSERRRLELLPEIAVSYHQLVMDADRELDVDVTTAIEMSDELRTKLEAKLSETTGNTVRLHTSVEPDIIGGMLIRHGDTMIDTTLRGRLTQLHRHIISTTTNPST